MEKSDRLMSLDALRGFDMLFISGLAAVVGGLCGVLGVPHCAVAESMVHAKWVGFHHHDTIFPLFIFLAGVSFPFSCASRRAKGATTGSIVATVLRRALLLVALGVLYGGFCTRVFDGVPRYASVLGRIGLAWGGAALLYLFLGWRSRLWVAAGILVGYWALQAFVPPPDATALAIADKAALAEYWLTDPLYINGPWSLNGCLNGWVDRCLLPGRLLFNGPAMVDPALAAQAAAAGSPIRLAGWAVNANGVVARGLLDPEGILSTVPAIVTAMLGMFAGELVRSGRLTPGRRALALALAGVACLALTLAWRPWCPIIKNIWTSTFTLAAAAYSFLVFALFYWVIDVLKFRRWTLFFRVVGLNSITIYLLQRIVNVGDVVAFFLGRPARGEAAGSGLLALCSGEWAFLLSQLGYLAVCWLAMGFLYRQKCFLKV